MSASLCFVVIVFPALLSVCCFVFSFRSCFFVSAVVFKITFISAGVCCCCVLSFGFLVMFAYLSFVLLCLSCSCNSHWCGSVLLCIVVLFFFLFCLFLVVCLYVLLLCVVLYFRLVLVTSFLLC